VERLVGNPAPCLQSAPLVEGLAHHLLETLEPRRELIELGVDFFHRLRHRLLVLGWFATRRQDGAVCVEKKFLAQSRLWIPSVRTWIKVLTDTGTGRILSFIR
jgi:hypothetical protein